MTRAVSPDTEEDWRERSRRRVVVEEAVVVVVQMEIHTQTVTPRTQAYTNTQTYGGIDIETCLPYRTRALRHSSSALRY